jgi:hypothetical protein
VRVEGRVGVGKASSLGAFLKELKVDDRPRMPNLARVGDDLVDALEPWRNSGAAGPPNPKELVVCACEAREGDGEGEAKPPSAPMSSTDGERSDLTAGDSVPGILVELAEARGGTRACNGS